jgi:hypothetical protein
MGHPAFGGTKLGHRATAADKQHEAILPARTFAAMAACSGNFMSVCGGRSLLAWPAMTLGRPLVSFLVLAQAPAQ